MSSGSNYSVPLLHGIFNARSANFNQLYDEHFAAQQTRLVQRPDQAGALEQRNLKGVLAICKTFVATSKQIKELDSLFDAYDVAQPYFQPQLRDEIIAEMDGIGEMIQDLVRQLEELGGIDATVTQ